MEELLARAHDVRDRLRVGPGFDLGRVDPRGTPGLPRRPVGEDPKAWSRAEVTRLGLVVGANQEKLFAGAQAGTDRRRVLLVLQALDCGGKDGTIRGVVGAMNPLGVTVRAFGVPTAPELAHHFLWRIQRALPPAGYVGVFNRSHYEDVLVARVRGLVPPAVWRGRYDEINRFERDLAADGQTTIKIMLHISPEEQRERLLERLDNENKRWKFQPGDLDDRDRWDDYQAAYAEALARCSTPDSPWYVVPADRKWYRNWAVANILLAQLDDLRLTYPTVDLDLADLRRRLGTRR